MFGYVMADVRELDKAQFSRYNQVYCGVCRNIRRQASSLARFGLSYDTTFLALLLMSLYEPEEVSGKRACRLHPLNPRPWTDSEFIQYAADMNTALAYYKGLDDYEDEGSAAGKWKTELFGKSLPQIQEKYSRQCSAMERCIRELARLEAENCPNPDHCAACFGQLMGELFVYREDLWADTLRQMGMALGRFIYLADAAVDFAKDKRRGRYNPFLAMGQREPQWDTWEQYLVLEMGRCTHYYEQLPLVQDKQILDNILYSGVWIQYRRHSKGT